jgi:hypothetical protein
MPHASGSIVVDLPVDANNRCDYGLILARVM